jgi:hypothetical protein
LSAGKTYLIATTGTTCDPTGLVLRLNQASSDAVGFRGISGRFNS